MSLHPSAVLRSDRLAALDVRHGFFTRQGGVSRPPWDSLNFSTATGDSPVAVADSFGKAAAWLGVESGRVYVLSQVHGCEARVLVGEESSAALLHQEGDIVISHDSTLACGVRVADCAPVLMVDRRSGWVAAAHAGWRGVVRGVVGTAVRTLRQLAGAPLELIVAVGPHIESCCFEVGEEVAAELAAASAKGDVAVDRSRSRPHVDLRAIIESQLQDLTDAPVAVDHVRGCTVCDPARFHSYRRDGARGGRMLAAVVPRMSPS